MPGPDREQAGKVTTLHYALTCPLVVRENHPVFQVEGRSGVCQAGEEEPAPLGHGKAEASCGEPIQREEGKMPG